ncbi:hypothetical protein OY671_006089 [Metschnikowia pulcherrima]|nr:hypothetical protein OY671_006089 [Metschnikowia pulcherrima]
MRAKHIFTITSMGLCYTSSVLRHKQLRGIPPQPLANQSSTFGVHDYQLAYLDSIYNANIQDAPSDPVKQKYVSERLDEFKQILREYVTYWSFRYVTFEADFAILGEQFVDIAATYKFLVPPSTTLTNKFIHAHSFFDTMAFAKDKFMYGNVFDDVKNRTIADILELQVLALSMFDATGQPDTTMTSFRNRSHSLGERLISLRDTINNITLVPRDILMTMWSEYLKAESLITRLISTIAVEN